MKASGTMQNKSQHKFLLLDCFTLLMFAFFFLGGGPSVETVALVAQFPWSMIDGNTTANHSKISSIFSGGYEVSNTNHQSL